MDKDSMRRLEDLEETVEKLRSDKRRKDAEIERLESELADSKSIKHRKRLGPGSDQKPQGIDPVAFVKLQEAADEKLKRASDEWETERAKLLSQINRLEGAVAEAIARASNPLRATQSVKEQFELELKQIVREKTEIEQAYLRAKTEWEQEKLKMTGEVVKLRRAAQIMGRAVPKEDSPDINPKVRELERRLQDAHSRWNAERAQLADHIQKIEEASRQWDTERRQLNDHAGQLQQAYVQAQAKIQTYEVAARAPNASEAKLDELKREKEAIQQQLGLAQNKWQGERHELNAHIERLEQQLNRMGDTRDRVSSEVVDQLRRQYEQRLQEAIQQKTQLAQDLQSASALLEAERTRLSAAQAGTRAGNLDTDAINAEIARVEGLLGQIIAIIDDPDTELSTVIRKNVEKAELDAYLKGILFSLGKKKG
jgi:DNA repair exonuclease SbcCD ATPase subunit